MNYVLKPYILFFSSSDKSKIKKKSRTNVEVTEVDPGHRHWSAVHWMYPGLFHPIGTKTHKEKEKQIKTQTYGQSKLINKVTYLIIDNTNDYYKMHPI